MEASVFAIPSCRSALADEVRYQLPSQDITAGLCPHRGRVQLGSHTGLSWAHECEVFSPGTAMMLPLLN